MIDWERRRKNIRILCAANNVTATEVANEQGMSPNTLTKFLNSKDTDRGLSAKSLALIVEFFGLTEVADLDTDNPLNDPKAALRRIIDGLDPEEAMKLNRELEVRFGKNG